MQSCSSSDKGGLEPLNGSFLYILIKAFFLLHSTLFYLVLYFVSWFIPKSAKMSYSLPSAVRDHQQGTTEVPFSFTLDFVSSTSQTLQPLCHGVLARTSLRANSQMESGPIESQRTYTKPKCESLTGGCSLYTQLMPGNSVSTLVPGTSLVLHLLPYGSWGPSGFQHGEREGDSDSSPAISTWADDYSLLRILELLEVLHMNTPSCDLAHDQDILEGDA